MADKDPLTAIYSTLSSIDIHLGEIAQCLRDQAQEAKLLREVIERHLRPRPARVVSVSRANYSGEEVEEGIVSTVPLGKDKGSAESSVVGTGGVPGFRRR